MGSRNRPSRKRKQEKREKRKQRGGGAHRGPVSWKQRMERAGRWPLVECWITGDLHESRHAHVLIAREGPTSVGIAVFDVDAGCLGVKGCVRDDDFTREQYHDLVDELSEDLGLAWCEPAFAVKLVQTAVRYASDLGFRPHPDYETAKGIFGDIDPAASSEEIELGENGKPFYVAMPDDDSAGIVRRLLESRGPDGFALVLPRAGLASALDGPPPPGKDPSPERRAWMRVRNAATAAASAVLKLAVALRGEKLFLEARDEFTRAAPELADDELAESTWFGPWALFTWRNHGLETGGAADPQVRPLALQILAEPGSGLGELERQFIEAACARPFSFHAIESIEPGRGIGLRDIMTGESHFVLYDYVSDQVRPGAVLFGRVVPLEGVAVLAGFGDDLLPPVRRIHAIELRETIAGEDRYLTHEELHDHHDVLRVAYWKSVAATFDPGPAPLENTDGEPLVEHELAFRLSCTPADALEALRSLAFEWDDDDFEEGTTRDEQGVIRAVELPWLVPGNRMHASWSNTVCARLTIDGEDLYVDVNSEARAERVRAEIERRLGDRVVHVETLAQDPEDRLPLPPHTGPIAADTTCAPASTGGSRAALAAMHRAWLDREIPALGGKTPRQAVGTSSGRERVEALLREMEWRDEMVVVDDRMDVATLRQELGLTVS